MKKVISGRVLAISMAAVLVFSLTACGGNKTTQATTNAPATEGAAQGTEAPAETNTDTIKIGLTVPLTGDRATEGSYGSNAAKLVQEEINANGGVLGRNIEIVIEDSLGTDVGATTAYLKLASEKDISAIIGSDNSSDNIAIAGSVASAQIPTTVQGSSPTLQTTCEESDWMFQLRSCDSSLCAALMTYAVKDMGNKTFTVIHDTETASSDQGRLFTQAIEELGGTVDADIAFSSGTKDFSAQLAQAQSEGSDAIVIACLQTEAAILIQQLRAMGITKDVYGSNAFSDPVTIDLAGDAINDAYSVTAWVPNTPTELGSAWSMKYHDTYNEDCAKAAAQIRDHVYVICEAITEAGSTDRTAVRDALLGMTDYQGAITSYDCSRKGNCGLGGLIAQVKDLQPVIVKEVAAE